MVDSSSTMIYDLIIIGGGVVGLAVLRAATLEGWHCALVESETELLSQASGSNSGIACTGVDAKPGTLERALIRDAASQIRIYCRDHNLPTRPCGSLVCLWPWDEGDRLPEVLAESHEAGDTHAKRWTPEQVRQIEPNLATSCRGAVHVPGEIVMDPWLYSISLAVHARENGAAIFTNFCVDAEACHLEDGIWTMIRKAGSSLPNDYDSPSPSRLRAKAVVNAAGIWADVVQAQAHGTKTWTAKPRRGQYQIYDASDSSMITHPIQPVPSQFTKGIFVFSTLYNQLVVGPTALDQESRTDRSVDPQVAWDLDAVIQRVIPNLDTRKAYVGNYVGIRPGTDQRDYQIHVFPKQHWVAAAGIRSTGLTASLGIGNYVVRQLQSVLDVPEPKKPDVKTSPMPSVSELARDFHDNHGYVFIHGHRYKVTHPLTKLGWQSKKGLASSNPSRL
jgi:glycerol-3-phosphate dehydrogenase